MALGSSSTLDPLVSLGQLQPGKGASDKDLASALHDINAATAAGQPTASLFTGSQRDLAASGASARFPAGLRSVVSIRSSPAREIDPTANWMRVLRPRTTRGPFLNGLGEEIWIDTFVLPGLTAVMAQNLFGQRTLLARVPVRGLAAPGSRIRLGPGTVWMPARTLTSGRTAEEMVGVSIRGGTLIVTGPATTETGAVIVSGEWRIELRLTLEHAAAPTPADGPGADATNAQVTLPTAALISLTPAGLQSIRFDDASATVYGTTVAVSRNDAAPFFDELTRSVVVPGIAEPDAFAFADVRSAIWRINGRSRITRSGWALAVVSADPNALGEASSAGSLWLDLDAPLAVEWNGLPEAARAPRTVLSLMPGTLVVTSTTIPREVRQRVELWNENHPEAPRRSSFELESVPGSVVVHLSQAGMDAILFNASLAAHLDRPLAADGGRLRVRIPTCWFSVFDLPAGINASVLANDTSAPAGTHVAFALENAFIKARPPVWLFASGPLTDQGLASGRVLLRFPFRFVLPTLPDPYASSFDIPAQDTDIGWATASVTWADPDSPTLAFTILPTQGGAEGSVRLANTSTTTFSRGRDFVPVLVDVSSNVDQFGVAIPLLGGAAASLQIAGMSLIAEARHVAVMTLPPISWEPMLTKTPEPGAAGDIPLPPPPHDGGPALLTADTVELRPVEPLPLLTTYHDAIRQKRHFNARLPLPFGLVANIDSRGPGGDAPESTFDGTVFFNRPTFGGAITGGQQVAIKGRPGVPGTTDFFISGYLTAELQDQYAKGVLSENLLEGVMTSFGRGANGLPLKRYDLSGYGASVFSDWRDPEAEGPAIIQARFDVLTGRTSHEVIQMQSALDPVHARVVRTITIDRHPGGWILREDSGWQPASDGRFLFKDIEEVNPDGSNPRPIEAAFPVARVHKGAVEMVVNIRNIRLNGAQLVLPSTGGPITWQPVLYDADVLFANPTDPLLSVTEGSFERRVPSRNLTGWIQINGPIYHALSKNGTVIRRVKPASGRQIADLLMMHGPAAGPME